MQALAAEQVTAVSIGHRQRITVHAVTGFELPLEVSTPDIIRRQYLTRRLAGVTYMATSTFLGHQPVSAQDIAYG